VSVMKNLIIMMVVCVLIWVIFMMIRPASAQGIYMLNGRATPQVIVGAEGSVWPVIPNPCYGGPCPVILAKPLPWRAPPRYAVPPPYALQPLGGNNHAP
jgi:hypothetical protein